MDSNKHSVVLDLGHKMNLRLSCISTLCTYRSSPLYAFLKDGHSRNKPASRLDRLLVQAVATLSHIVNLTACILFENTVSREYLLTRIA